MGCASPFDHLGRGYAAAGHARTLVVPGRAWVETGDDDDRRIEVPGRRVPGLDPYLVITDVASVAARLDALAPDVIEVSDKLTLHRLSTWARRRGVGTVLVSHERLDGHLAPHVPRVVPLARMSDAVNRRLSERFDAIVCASAWAAEEFERIGAIPVRVPLGVDLATFRPRPNEPGAKGGTPTVVWFGRMSREKRPDLAAAMFRVLADRGVAVRAVMIGDGPLRAQLEASLAPLPVTFTGHVGDRHELARHLASADVVVNTCPAETFGLTVLEAMACGTPVVVANRGAARELVSGRAGTATFVHPKAFASAVCEVLAWPVAERRAAARARAEAFPWVDAVDRMLAVHADVAARAAHRPSRPAARARSSM